MSAIFSPDRKYRYRLDRPVRAHGIVIAFFGVNPSTAAEEVDDQTSRKWFGFSDIHCARKYIVGNPFAYVATAVKDLASATDPVGPMNDTYLAEIITAADWLVPCWGSRNKLPVRLRPRLDLVEHMLRRSGKPLKIFGLTQSADPMHPLMVGYDTELIEWKDNLI
jgi:hypothetical protein